ncbi:hypothetical protein HMPREF0290_2826 [Corynebacterium efficiens YS-314]|uniref:Transposase DDE domain-containing protein n=1 Tax=Corynebacterium efficiens (strain DSM 44549 / YS-314 / AJ 12310 / JCM 11189 / NBRC 100395) TaxID=196164 RepID=Q8FLL1_COREF|nr:hypothetical protein HMPREF0290_2826 [Corynebacterium efficiens YS-314]BAC19667.1 hypothetical protein [Corynebacterium efficiens YS-314]
MLEICVLIDFPDGDRRLIPAADSGYEWETMEYTDALFDEDTGRWISSAEGAEVPFVAFASKPEADQVPGRQVVRRIPELNKKNVDQPGLFDLHRFHAVFTTADPALLDTVAADKTHRRHAIIEQVNADLKNSALAHMPSGVFTAWLVLAVMTFNLTRTTGVIAAGSMARPTTATIRRQVIAVAARVTHRSRRLVLHLPEDWTWEARSGNCSITVTRHRLLFLPDHLSRSPSARDDLPIRGTPRRRDLGITPARHPW